MPTHNSHTHYQAAQANAKNPSLVKSVSAQPHGGKEKQRRHNIV